MIFYKYHGAGNDFIMVDQRESYWLTRDDQSVIEQLCDRRFGIGADGLILLETNPVHGYEMIYFNADGRESTMCGNGGRCFAAFAKHLGIAAEHFNFIAIDGPHEALLPHPLDTPGGEWVELQMIDVENVEIVDNQTFILNTGSPHYISITNNLDQLDVVKSGKSVRYNDRFAASGINVNFVAPDDSSSSLNIRTYERGVEDETLACGTGVTAAALAFSIQQNWPDGTYQVPVRALGGQLSVRYQKNGQQFSNIWLCGPAQSVFAGELALPTVQ